MRSATWVNWPSLALLVLALIAATPLWTGPGLVNTRAGGDSPFLFIRLHQLVENLRAGVFPARWMPDTAYGLGYPLFNFYASLPYYVAAVFNLAGFDLLTSLKIVQSLGFVFAAWGMYGWVQSAWGENSSTRAWLAAVAYTFAPFHLVNVYVRGDSLSEFYAFVFYPLILWAIDKVIDRPRPRSVAVLGFAYGGLIMAHNVSALIFSPFILLYIFVRAARRLEDDSPRVSAFRTLGVPSASGILLGLLLSAWFWLPALGEAPLVQLDVQTTGYFNYAGHFRSTNLVQSSLGFDYDSEPPHTPFAMGLVQAIATVAGVIALIVTWRRSRGPRAFVLVGLIVSTLMVTPLSKPLWVTLPFLPLTQFPWRFLSVQALFTSPVIGYLVSIPKVPGRLNAGMIGLALAASVLLPLHPDYLPIRADEITPERIQLYEAFTTNIGTTIRAEYLPRTMIPRPYTGPALIDPSALPRAIVKRGDAQSVQTSRSPTSQIWAIRAASDATLAIPTLYFPGWQASIDGQPIGTRAAPDLGYIEVDVPAGEHTLLLTLGRGPIRAAAEIVSLVAALGMAGILTFGRRRTTDEGRRSASFVLSSWHTIAVLALACVLAVSAISTHTLEARDDDLVMDFESKPWLHHATGADFDGVVRLAHYSIAKAIVGKPLEVSIEWVDLSSPNLAATVELVTPSLHAFGAPEPIASARTPIRPGTNRYTLDVPASLSRGLYYVRLVVDKSRAVFLKPVFYGGSPAASESAGWAHIGDEIELGSVHLKHDVPDRLTAIFDWSALKPIAANYAVSLRLQDVAGHAWVTLDTQPGYGFQPTSAWQPGENQRDVYTLALPADMPRDAAYSLDVVWYRVAAKEELGRVRLPGVSVQSIYGLIEVLPTPRSFDVPPMRQRVDAVFGDAIKLLGYDVQQAGNKLTLTLHWQALMDIGTDYKFFVHVFDPATQRIAVQVDAMPGGNAYPTSRWVKGEVVSEVFELTVDRSGTYRAATGWYDPVSQDRLKAIDAQGEPAAADRVILGGDIRVP